MTKTENKVEAPPTVRIQTPHDGLFKLIFDDTNRSHTVLKCYLPPAITKRMSSEPPKLVEGSFIDPALRASQSDRLFEVKLTAKKPALIYALLEHKSRPDPLTPFQIADYKLKIWRRYYQDHGKGTKLPPIIALVFYHGAPSWSVPLSLDEMIDRDDETGPLPQTLNYSVHHLRPDAVAGISDPEVRGGFLCLCLSQAHGKEEDVARMVEIIRLVKDSRDLAMAVLRYIFHVVAPPRAVFTEVVRQVNSEQVEVIVGSYYQELLAEGEAKGVAKGEARGEVKGMVKAFLKLARAKFGTVPEEIAATVRQASPDDVDRWFMALINAEDINEIFET